ncbi:MAG: prolipoprotein diacylglyceryl transferase [Acidimicrobiia bacterium]
MPAPISVLGSIPSPSVNGFDIGPLRVTFYGVCIAVGVALAWSLLRRRYVSGGGDSQTVERIVLWMLVIGFLGARLGYVVTHSGRFADEWWKVIAIWEGGLAFFGGLTAGAVTAVVLSRTWGADLRLLTDAAAPALPLAQAVGRWGNYFNQELFGTPTELPWGLEIDPANRPAEYADAATFHPTFLYESLGNLILVGVILWCEQRYPAMRGRLLAIYLIGYGVLRFLMELLRTDTTFRLLGLSRNGWVSLGAIAVGVVVAVKLRPVEREGLSV